MSENGFFRISKWLPRSEGGVNLDADLTGWVAHFVALGIKAKIRRRADGRISLWREGQDSFPNKGEETDEG